VIGIKRKLHEGLHNLCLSLIILNDQEELGGTVASI
jgi:hypothetical protein